MPRLVSIYPREPGDRISLRAEPDWDVAQSPIEDAGDRVVFDLPIEAAMGVRQAKLVLEREGVEHWSVGENYLCQRSVAERTVYPCFRQGSGRLTGAMTVAAPALDDRLTIRAYLPPGYDENHLKRYPVLYAADGANLFNPAEAALGQEWEVDETVSLLNRMSAIDKIIVVGVYARGARRGEDYTLPGYVRTGRSLVEDLLPRVDAAFRTLPTATNRAVIGSSLGGVLALHLWWAHPASFGSAAALSATLGYQDDLFERIAIEEPRAGRLYLDSGFPHDNFEVVRKMAALLRERGIRPMYLAHPRGIHNELSWADRLHLPLEHLFGDREPGEVGASAS